MYEELFLSEIKVLSITEVSNLAFSDCKVRVDDENCRHFLLLRHPLLAGCS